MSPQRIVCLTDETTETLYLLGRHDLIVGVSGYSTRPPEARNKPRVCAFTSAKIDKILELKPDLVIGFSNLQSDIARDLIRAGCNVLVTNQRSVEEILETILLVGRIVNAVDEAVALVRELRTGMERVAATAPTHRPSVYFEEWNDPLISGIRWVEELVEIAGGRPIFPELRHEHDAVKRVVAPEEVIARDPEVIIASWCGREVNREQIAGRPGWDTISAVKSGRIHEIKSTVILQPGPASVGDGLRQLQTLLSR